MSLEPLWWIRQKTECNDHHIRGHHLLGSRNGFRNAPATRSRRTETRLHQLHAFHPIGAHDLDGLAIEEELHALFLAVLVVAARAGHVLLVAAVGTGDRLRALADRGAIAVHSGI